MNPEMTEGVGTDTAKKQVDVSVEEPGTLAKPSAPGSKGLWQQFLDQGKAIGAQFNAILSELPKYVGEFFGEYRRPIATIALILTAIIAVKVTLAVLDALNDLPLLAPTFELIGIGYTAWFTWRYLVRASDREELQREINNLKDQILGIGNNLSQ
ncbi:CAAD domain-containing protein [Trichothermofontia sichuanensis B231]|uniref:CAAD domain-containing protein n=1 Tax=Trichothermofontia sichuanensis TaxID=3045816 RepID=UPI00224742F9|nr:CAAD domain-containing protein [Trichothermofontia sichuanensis]UZQ53840.1 CAAD domain-containing protein [Trichothermofontia sichuanensis B231]